MSDNSQILQKLGGGQPVNINKATLQIESPAIDAVMTLNTNVASEDDVDTRTRNRTDSDGNTVRDADGRPVEEEYRIYSRTVTANIDYQVVRVPEGSLVGQGRKSGNASDSDEDQNNLSSELRGSALTKALSDLASDLVPTERSIEVKLEKEADNKEAKKEMGAADSMVKAKDYAGAAEAYGAVYAKYKNFAAGYNYAILTEVAKGTAAAVELMEVVARESGNPLAQTTLREMQSRNSANQRAAAQLAQ
jgi:hypothetical protein